MKHLKLFFALFAMLALGVTNAWGAEETATLSFADKAQRTSYSTTQQVWKQNGITFTNNKFSSTSNVGDYANPARLYKNSEIIVECDLGNITQIVFDCNTDTYATSLGKSANVTTVSGDKVTVTCDGSSKTYNISGLSDGQVRIDALIVTYTSPSGGGDPGTGGEETDPVDPTITFSDGAYTVGGAALDLSTLWESNSTGTVTYSVKTDGGTGATISGSSFTATAAGTCTVQASQAAATGYNAITKTATIIVSAAQGGENSGITTDATLSFANTSQRTVSTTDQQVWEQNGIIFTYDKANYSNNLADYSNPIRLYQGTTITIGCNGNITKIVFATNASKYVELMETSLKDFGTVSTDGNNVTLVLTTPASSVGPIALSAQVRLNSITVTYEKQASAEPTITCSNSVNFGVVLANATQEFVVEGENLTENISATLSAGTAFVVSGDLTDTGGTLTLTVTAIEEGTYTDKLTLKSGETTKEIEVSATVVVCEGEGTEENPYTIDDVKKLANPGTSAWVEGYIVGIMKDNKCVQPDAETNSNIAIAATIDETEIIVSVALPAGAVRTGLNLVDNPGNLGKRVAVYGTLEKYFETTGVKNTSKYRWVAAEGAPETPTFTPVAGTYFVAQNVTITAEDGATIYYTTDGTDPTTSSTVYSTPIAVSQTTTVKAIAVKGEQVSPVASAKYTINLPLTTMDEIFAKATEVGTTATSVQVVINNWVVTGVKGSNAYLTDGTKGLIIYTASHGFVVGDVLSGTVLCKVQLYKGASELTELTSTTEGLTVTTGGTVTPVLLDEAGINALTGANTGSVIKINGVFESGNVISGVKLYNSLYAYEALEVGAKYNVTGVYVLYDSTKEILPRNADDIEMLEGLQTATISIPDITMEVGQEKTFEATITPDAAIPTVQYAITSGSDFITLNGTTITANAVGTATITATIAEVAGEYYGTTKTFTVTVNAPNIATLPFSFNGGKNDIADTKGMSQSGLGSDYSAAPKLKFDGTGDWVVIRFDSEPEKLSYDIKNNSFSGGTFSVQESADGETYTDVKVHTEITETQNEEHTLLSTSRYVKFIYKEKVNGNIGLGNIQIAKPDTRQEAGIAWSTESIEITVGEDFTAPTLSNPHSVSDITYETSNDAVATVTAEGVIALVSDAVGTATITAKFGGDDDYKAAEVSCTIKVKEIPEDCEGSDDFATDESESPLSYKERTTAAGWKATNAARVTIEDETYFAINGKTSAVGTITSPVLNGGIGSIKIRYANTYSENNGVSFKLDIKQNDEVVKTYTVTKAKAEVVQNTVYTELIEDINVEGDFVMVFTNLSPSNDTGNKDRVSIGRLCWTNYEEEIVEPTTIDVTLSGMVATPESRMGRYSYLLLEDEDGNRFSIYNGSEGVYGNDLEVTGYLAEYDVTVSGTGDWQLVDGVETLTATLQVEDDNTTTYNVTATVAIATTITLECYDATYTITDPELNEVTFTGVADGKEFTIKVAPDGEGYYSDGEWDGVVILGTEVEFDNSDPEAYYLGGTYVDEAGNTYEVAIFATPAVVEPTPDYIRSTTAGKFGTLCLPFGGEITGAVLYECVGRETDGVLLGSVETLEAGVPYIFLATGTELAVYSDGTTAATPVDHNGLHGTFDDETVVDAGNYIVYENKLCKVVSDVKVNANRAYLVMNEVPTEPVQQMPGRRYIGMSVQGENETTSVEDLFTTDAPAKVIVNGQLIIIRNGEKYNVQGQKL